MRPTSMAIQLPAPWQFQQAMPHRGVPWTSACPGHRNPQPAGRTSPCAATHWRAAAQRSAEPLLVGCWATTGDGGGWVTRGGVAGGAEATRVVFVAGRGFTVVDVDVLVDVDGEIEEVDVEVLETGGSATTSATATTGRGS